ncbi:GNAT family N-acetyltransferase [Endozoicomonas sp. G2_2]|nr:MULTISPECIES: GNAT family N-acetyltransferase [Gammaproteobacteria]MBO9471219.1 GNAT family N-acetyltransferase [Endozoicomonas sp. G2_2]
MQQNHIPILIEETSPREIDIDLLLLADPSVKKIRSYLPRSKCFTASVDGRVIGACVVQRFDARKHEIMSIAVHPDKQMTGVGSTLLGWVIQFVRKAGAHKLEVGTGTFGYQLAFYQRQGFRVTSIDRDFFITNYDERVFEDGIQLLDMLRLTFDYQENRV